MLMPFIKVIMIAVTNIAERRCTAYIGIHVQLHPSIYASHISNISLPALQPHLCDVVCAQV